MIYIVPSTSHVKGHISNHQSAITYKIAKYCILFEELSV